MAQDYWTTIGVPAGQGKPLMVKRIRWINPGAAGTGSFVIGDTFGNVLEQGNAPAASLNVDQDIPINPPRPWRNWQLTTFTGGGTLEIDYE